MQLMGSKRIFSENLGEILYKKSRSSQSDKIFLFFIAKQYKGFKGWTISKRFIFIKMDVIIKLLLSHLIFLCKQAL